MRNDFDEVKKSQSLAERMPHHKQIAVCQAREKAVVFMQYETPALSTL